MTALRKVTYQSWPIQYDLCPKTKIIIKIEFNVQKNTVKYLCPQAVDFHDMQQLGSYLDCRI